MIDKCISILRNNPSLDSLITICDVGSYHPFRMKFIDKNNLVKNVIDQGFEDMRPIQKKKKHLLEVVQYIYARKKLSQIITP